VLVGGAGGALGQRGVRVDGGGQAIDLVAGLDPSGQLGDGLAAGGRGDRGAYQAAARVGDQEGEATGLGLGDRAVDQRVVGACDGRLRAPAFARLGLGETHPGHLGVGERDPRDGLIDHAPGAEQGVDGGHARMVRGDVGERKSRRDVAGGVDAASARAQPVVDDHRAVLVDGDAGGL